MTRSVEYERHIKSPAWFRLRELVRVRAGRRCERCGHPAGLEVHHKTYERLGRERLDDLELLCRPCHSMADAERAGATASRSWNARLDGWASKVYGDNWDTDHNPDSIEEHFERWLDGKEEL